MDNRREALENGDFATVWDSFSQRKKAEMAKGGISQDGFLRVQNRTHRVDSAVKQTVLKTKPESDTQQLVLIKQSQPERPDIFVKQLWVFEDESWKLDDEQKKTAEKRSRCRLVRQNKILNRPFLLRPLPPPSCLACRIEKRYHLHCETIRCR